jgi:hydroxymethylpyrimidine pyrophosphatase-like HAD family hydrolase
MLEYVGLGVAMGNGEDRLKQKADFITKKASEGGILFALKRFGVVENV